MSNQIRWVGLSHLAGEAGRSLDSPLETQLQVEDRRSRGVYLLEHNEIDAGMHPVDEYIEDIEERLPTYEINLVLAKGKIR